MAAPKGNKFWELRSKHGRDKLFETPALMWEAACEYFEWCEANALIEIKPMTVNIGDYMSKVESAEIPKMRAFTIWGLCRHLGCNSKYFNDFEDGIKGKEDEISKGFSEVITRIRETIIEQKFTGAAAGFLNASIIAMDLGMKAKSEIELNDNRKDIKDVFAEVEAEALKSDK